MLKKVEFRAERANLRPGRASLGPERPKLGPESSRGDIRTNGRMNKSPPIVLQDFIPFGAAAQKDKVV